MDDLAGAAQPHCPDCDVVMRDHYAGFRCAECGRIDDHSDEMAAVVIPPMLDGPDLDERRRA